MRRCNYLMIAGIVTAAGWATCPRPATADDDRTISEVYSLNPDDPDVKGYSTLVRTDDGVSIMLMTSDLPPGAYTCWWVIANPGVPGTSAGFATSHVVGPSGEGTFAANLREGEPLSTRGALLDAWGANVRLVVRYHGPADPKRLNQQLHTFQPELDTDGDPDTGNFQFSDHLAP